jgi:hypothetical protein
LKPIRLIILFSILSNVTLGQYSWHCVGNGANGHVNVLAADTIHNQLYAGGIFSEIDNLPIPSVAKYNGISFSQLGCNPLDFQSFPLTGIAYNGDFYCGGNNGAAVFSSCAGVNAPFKMRYDYNQDTWAPIGYDWGTSCNKITTYQGQLAFGGIIGYIDSNLTNANCVTIWDGNQFSPVGINGNYGVTWNGPSSPQVYVFDLIEFNNELFVNGFFTSAGGNLLTSFGMARWNGSTWQSAGSTIGILGEFCIFNNELYFGGYGDINIYKWDGNDWPIVATHNGAGIVAMTTYNNSLIATGTFTSINGIPANNIASYDGSQWSALGGGLEWPSNNLGGSCLAVFNNELYVGGLFTIAGGVTCSNLAKWGPTSYIDYAPESAGLHLPVVTNGTLKLNNIDNPVTEIAIIDLSGRIIINQSYADESIDVSTLRTGVYLVKLIFNNGNVNSQKVLIENNNQY